MLDMTFGTRKARYHHSGLLTTSLRLAEGCGAKGRDLKWLRQREPPKGQARTQYLYQSMSRGYETTDLAKGNRSKTFPPQRVASTNETPADEISFREVLELREGAGLFERCVS